MLKKGMLIGGKYRITGEIGRGGMSVVYKAVDETTNNIWAVKEVRKDGVINYETVKQGLIMETGLLKRLNHPRLPHIADIIENENAFFIVMDYIEGHTLSEHINKYGAQPQEMVIKWSKQICEVLGYLHSREPAIIYRDVKPANIMLKPDGNIMLIDFGTAREYKKKNTADTTCLGTVGYAAPEQFGGAGQTDERTDIYCLGVTMYNLVTGCNPCEPPYELKPLRHINPDLSERLDIIINKCTQKNPKNRYQSCNELINDLGYFDKEKISIRKKYKVSMTAVTISAAILCIAILQIRKNIITANGMIFVLIPVVIFIIIVLIYKVRLSHSCDIGDGGEDNILKNAALDYKENNSMTDIPVTEYLKHEPVSLTTNKQYYYEYNKECISQGAVNKADSQPYGLIYELTSIESKEIVV